MRFGDIPLQPGQPATPEADRKLMIIDALEQGKAEWAPPPLPATMREVLSSTSFTTAARSRRTCAR
jgi:hypothetical protein